jgi:hypothetical protein
MMATASLPEMRVQYIYTRPHSITALKSVNFMVTTLRTSNLTGMLSIFIFSYHALISRNHKEFMNSETMMYEFKTLWRGEWKLLG